MKTSKVPWQSWGTLLLLFLLLISVRFNRNGWLVQRDLHDAYYYMANVAFFRGDPLPAPLAAPFNERLLVTFVAAGLPFEPMTAINVANVLFLLLALFFLHRLLTFFKLSEQQRWVGMYLFVFSFPTLYYATIGYVDSGVLAMILMGTYAVYRQKYLLFILALLLGTLAKEGAVLLVPLAVAYGYATNQRLWYVWAGAGLLLYLLVWGAVKVYMPTTQGSTPVLYWHPTSWRLLRNLSRPTFYISSLASFGLPGSLLVYFLAKQRAQVLTDWKQDLPLWVGTLSGLGLWVYGIFSAYADGRFFWITSCFPILLVVSWVDRYGLKYPWQVTRRVQVPS